MCLNSKRIRRLTFLVKSIRFSYGSQTLKAHCLGMGPKSLAWVYSLVMSNTSMCTCQLSGWPGQHNCTSVDSGPDLAVAH